MSESKVPRYFDEALDAINPSSYSPYHSLNDMRSEILETFNPELQNRTNPEVILEHKELWEELSQEARQIIDIIMSGPIEILNSPLKSVFLNFQTGRKRKGEKARIALIEFLSELWGDRKYAQQTVKEIQQYVKVVYGKS